jgi:short-subunit dehydrogenase
VTAGTVALVTGVSSGIGRETARLLDFGVLRVTQAVLPSMRRNGYGRIVNISSMLGLLPGP